MPKHKMITKCCPKCRLQVPVACKACPCGHAFITGRRSAISTNEGVPQRRRTERVKREKPNYYDALEYEKQMKKLKKKRTRSQPEEHNPIDNTESDQPRLKKKRKKPLKAEKEPEEEDIMGNLSPEKAYKCSLILAEINRKICVTSWRV